MRPTLRHAAGPRPPAQRHLHRRQASARQMPLSNAASSIDPLCLKRARRYRIDGSAQFRPQLLGDVMGVGAVADDLRTDEDDQLGPSPTAVVVAEQVAEAW